MTLQPLLDVVGVTPTKLVPKIERLLYGNQRTELNKLNGAVLIGASTLNITFDAGGIRPGAYMEIDDELLYVWAVANKVATVQRGMLGTTPAAHDDGAVVRVEPRFFRNQIADEVATEIRSWPTNVYARYSGELDWPAAGRAVDLAGLAGTSGASLIRVQASPLAGGDVWPRVDGARLERRQSSAFPSGYALVLPNQPGQGLTLRVVAKVPFNTTYLTATTDLGYLGITSDLADIIPWGVAGRLLMSRDVARTDAHAQGRSRPAEDVRTGDALQVGRGLLEQRNRMLAEAANRLMAEDGMGAA